MCAAQTKVIYNPIDIAKVERMGAEEIIKNDRFTIVMTGRLTPPKQVQRFVLIAKRFKDIGRNDVLFNG